MENRQKNAIILLRYYSIGLNNHLLCKKVIGTYRCHYSKYIMIKRTTIFVQLDDKFLAKFIYDRQNIRIVSYQLFWPLTTAITVFALDSIT